MTVLAFLNSLKEPFAYIAGGVTVGLVYLYLSIPYIDTVSSQDIPSNMVCHEDWIGVYVCQRKEDLMFAHRYN